MPFPNQKVPFPELRSGETSPWIELKSFPEFRVRLLGEGVLSATVDIEFSTDGTTPTRSVFEAPLALSNAFAEGTTNRANLQGFFRVVCASASGANARVSVVAYQDGVDYPIVKNVSLAAGVGQSGGGDVGAVGINRTGQGLPFFAFPRSLPQGAVVTGQSGASPTVTYEQFDGMWCMKIVTQIGKFADIALTLPAPVSVPSGDISAFVHIENAAGTNSVNLYAAEEVGYANYSYAGQLNAAAGTFPTIARDGYVNIGINLPTGDNVADPQREWVSGAGAGMRFATNAVVALKLRVTPFAATAATVRLFGIFYKEKAKPSSVVITFDDGWDTQYTAALPILQKYGLKVSLGVISPLVGSGGYMTWDNLREFVDSGTGECCVHGNPSNPAYPGRLNLACYDTEEEIRADLRANRDPIVANGLARNSSEKIYIYPQGVW